MADNPKFHCCGLVELVPPPQPPVKPSNKRRLITDCAQTEKTTRSSYSDGFSELTTRFDKKHKAEGFVERTTGRPGFKEEVKYKSTVKVDDKWSGCTDEYTTQVKLQKVTTYPPTAKAAPKSKNKRVGYH